MPGYNDSIKKTIEIIFGATDSNLGKTIDSVEKQLNTFGSGIHSVADPVAEFTKDLLKVEAAVGAAGAAMLAFALNEAAKFQTAQNDLKKVLTETDPLVDSFTQTVFDLSEAYGVSATSTLEGIATFRQAGFEAEAAALLQKNALDLVIAGDVEAAQATEILIAQLKGFNAQADESSRFIEALNNVSNVFATDLGQLAIGMSQISPVARTMGFSFEETTGLITPIIEVFRSGTEASNALKTGLLRLIDDSKPVGDALAKIGVSQFDLNGEMRSGKDIFLDVAKAFETLDENQKLVITGQLVGIDQAAKMVTVFDNLAQVQKVTAVALENTGSVTEEVNLRLESAEKQLDRFQQAFINLNIVVGDKVLDSFSGVIGGLTDIETALRKSVESGALNGFFDALNLSFADVGELFKEIAKNIPEALRGVDFDNLIKAFGNLRGEIGETFDLLFGEGLDLSKPEDLTKALQTAVNLAETFVNVTAGIIDGFSPVFDAIGEAGQRLSTTSVDVEVATGRVLAALTLLSDLGVKLGVVVIAIKEFGVEMENVFDLIIGTAKIFSNTLQITFDTAVGSVALFLEQTARLFAAFTPDAIGDPWTEIADNIEVFRNAVGQNLNSNIDDAVNGLVQMGQGLGFVGRESLKANQGIESTGETTQDTAGKVAQLQAEYDKLAAELKKINPPAKEFADTQEEVKQAVEEEAKVFEFSIDQKEEFRKKVDELLAQGVSFTRRMTENGFVIELLGAEFQKSGEKVKGFSNTTKEVFNDQAKFNQRVAELQASGVQFASVWEKNTGTITILGEASNKAASGLEKTKDATDDLTDSQRLAIEHTNELQLTLLKLASDERIAGLEFAADIQVAQIEADAATTVAAFESIAQSVGSTNELISDLFSHEAPEWDNFGFETREAIERAQDRAERLTDSQIELNDAQIRILNARAESLERGDAAITINADQLEPELQLVLKSLIENVQIQANQEGLELLI